MGKGSGDGTRPSWSRPMRAQGSSVSEARRSENFAGNATTAAVDGLQFPLNASQSQHPAGFSVGVLHVLEELDRVVGGLHEALRTSLRFVRNLCEISLPNGEKAGESSSKGNVAESSDALGKKLSMSKKFPGVGQRNDKFFAEIYLPGKKGKVWLGTFNTEEAACRAYQFAADWREAHRDRKSFSKEEEDDLKKRAKKAAELLSDDRSHHNVASPDFVENLEEKATTSASLKGKAVANEEHVSQRESLAIENVSSGEYVSQGESPVHGNFFAELVNQSPELNMNNCFQF